MNCGMDRVQYIIEHNELHLYIIFIKQKLQSQHRILKPDYQSYLHHLFNKPGSHKDDIKYVSSLSYRVHKTSELTPNMCEELKSSKKLYIQCSYYMCKQHCSFVLRFHSFMYVYTKMWSIPIDSFQQRRQLKIIVSI